ncbi:MAG TPA: glycosyltransferase family 4 protein [Gemmatimonadaceae bacterium]|nr:glycosyltransferase family 4 protein [Gemmatimonadaceae bacterium]
MTSPPRPRRPSQRPQRLSARDRLAAPVASRPRMLLLAQTLPFPPDGGVNIRIYNVLRLLSRHYDVTLLCFMRRAERQAEGAVAAGIAGLLPYADVAVFPIPQEYSRVRMLWDHLRSVVQRRAYTWYVYESQAFDERLSQLLTTRRFDVAQIDSLDLARYIPALDGMPVICVHHNVESALMERRAGMEASAWRRAYLRLQARWLARLETYWCRRVALNVAVSEPDRALLEAQSPGGRYTSVPNGVDIDSFRPAAPGGRESGIVSTGGLNWFPNADGLKHFCADILPRVRAVCPPDATTVRWVGRADDMTRRRLKAESDVELTGYVDDVRPYLRAAACFVVPLRVGGGTRLKILDAWAMGKAVVSTSVGCEGLDARDGENILVRDDPAAFAEAVTAVLRDPELRHRLGAAARRTVERTYSWDVIGEDLRDTLSTLTSRDAITAPRPAPARTR